MNSKIQIQTLLMEREEGLLEISAIEQKINTVLGQLYPFDPPRTLPSTMRRKKPKVQRGASGRTPLKIRPLDPETEAAYRIRYRQDHEECIEIHLDGKALARFAHSAPSSIQIHTIETVRQEVTLSWTRVQVLFIKNPEKEMVSVSSSA